jgi:hypothetical protein
MNALLILLDPVSLDRWNVRCNDFHCNGPAEKTKKTLGFAASARQNPSDFAPSKAVKRRKPPKGSESSISGRKNALQARFSARRPLVTRTHPIHH